MDGAHWRQPSSKGGTKARSTQRAEPDTHITARTNDPCAHLRAGRLD